jgi:hypothetical protein
VGAGDGEQRAAGEKEEGAEADGGFYGAIGSSDWLLGSELSSFSSQTADARVCGLQGKAGSSGKLYDRRIFGEMVWGHDLGESSNFDNEYMGFLVNEGF